MLGEYIKNIFHYELGEIDMIFVTLGSQKFQFNRLLKKIDQLINEGKIDEEVFAQTGYSDYNPKNFASEKFLDREKFALLMNKSDVIIAHGGTGAIVGALKANKKVIAIPRLAQYGEHVDDHQLQIVRQFVEHNFICTCKNLDELDQVIEEAKNKEFCQYISSTDKIIDSIERYINDMYN